MPYKRWQKKTKKLNKSKNKTSHQQFWLIGILSKITIIFVAINF